MSNQLRLLALIVVISGALCTVQDYVIMSQCAHNKAIYLAPEGKVFVTDIPMTQNITIAGPTDFWSTKVFKITLYAKETQMYLCFNTHWKLVGMKKIQDTCYFNESIVHGYFEYRSAVDPNRRVGFTHRGKAIGPKKNVTDACYFFTKIEADKFFHQYTDAFNQYNHHKNHRKSFATTLSSPTSASKTSTTIHNRSQSEKLSANISSSPMSLSPIKANSLNGDEDGRGRSSERNGQSLRGRKQRIGGGKGTTHPNGSGMAARNRGSSTVNRQPNGHNSNLSNSSTSNSRRGNNYLSSTNINHRNHHNHNNSHNNNVQQQPTTQLHDIHEHSQTAHHHQVRHHHNDPNIIARRQQYQREHKKRRLRNHQQHQQQQQQQQQPTKPMQRMTSPTFISDPVSSPMSTTVLSSFSLSMAESSPIDMSVLPSPNTTSTSFTSVTSTRRKGKRRKNIGKHKQNDLKNRRTTKQYPQNVSDNSSNHPTLSSSMLTSAILPTYDDFATLITPSPSTSLDSLMFSPTSISTTIPSFTVNYSSSSDLPPSDIPSSDILPSDSSSSDSSSSDLSLTTILHDFSPSSSLIIIDPTPTLQAELYISPSSSISPISPSISSSFDELLSPTPAFTDDLQMVMESIGDDLFNGTSTSTDDSSSSSSFNIDSNESSINSDDTSDTNNRSSTTDSTFTYTNYNDQYSSDDDASAMPVLPNNLDDRMTEYLYSTRSSYNRRRHFNNSNFKKYYHNDNIMVSGDKFNRNQKKSSFIVSNGVVTITPTPTSKSNTPTITINHESIYNLSSYLSTKNIIIKTNSSSSVKPLISTKSSPTTIKSIISSITPTTTIYNTSKYLSENVTNQPSSYYSTSSTKNNKSSHHNYLLDSGRGKYFNKKTTFTTNSTSIQNTTSTTTLTTTPINLKSTTPTTTTRRTTTTTTTTTTPTSTIIDETNPNSTTINNKLSTTFHNTLANKVDFNINSPTKTNYFPGEIVESTYDVDEIISGLSDEATAASSRFVAVGYLPTMTSHSSLPESIRIAKIKINRERRNRLRKRLHIGS